MCRFEDIGGLPFDHVVVTFGVSDGANSPGTAAVMYVYMMELLADLSSNKTFINCLYQ